MEHDKAPHNGKAQTGARTLGDMGTPDAVEGFPQAREFPGRNADALRSADLDAAAQLVLGRPLGLSEAAVARALDPAQNIASRTVLGGPGTMAAMLATRHATLARDAAALAAQTAHVEAARAGCFALARAF